MTKNNWVEWQKNYKRTAQIFLHTEGTHNAVLDANDWVVAATFVDNNVFLIVNNGEVTKHIHVHRNDVEHVEFK